MVCALRSSTTRAAHPLQLHPFLGDIWWRLVASALGGERSKTTPNHSFKRSILHKRNYKTWGWAEELLCGRRPQSR
jgi:hypothetical protein